MLTRCSQRGRVVLFSMLRDTDMILPSLSVWMWSLCGVGMRLVNSCQSAMKTPLVWCPFDLIDGLLNKVKFCGTKPSVLVLSGMPVSCPIRTSVFFSSPSVRAFVTCPWLLMKPRWKFAVEICKECFSAI